MVDILFTVTVLAVTVILMWVGYVQILNYLVDRNEKLKYEVLPKACKKEIQSTPDKIIKKYMRIKRIQQCLFIQCVSFFSIVLFSLVWIWNFIYYDPRLNDPITQPKDFGGCRGLSLFKIILVILTVSQIIHFVTFLCSFTKVFQKEHFDKTNPCADIIANVQPEGRGDRE